MSVSWEILLPDIPVASTRGALGWCSVTLVRSSDRVMIVDTGSYGDLALLLARLQEETIAPEGVDDVLLTHFHFDHVLNFDLFKNEMFHISATEIRDFINNEYKPANDLYVPAVPYSLLAPEVRSFCGKAEIWQGCGPCL